MTKALPAKTTVSIKPPVKVPGLKHGPFLCSKGHTLGGAGVSLLEWQMHPYYRARLKEAPVDAGIFMACLVLAAALAIVCASCDRLPLPAHSARDGSVRSL